MLNAATLPAITPELTEAVARYIAAKTYTASIRPLVEGYQREILAAGNFQYRTWPEDKRPGVRPAGRITEPRDAWQMDDAQAEAYYALLDAEHAAHGFNIAAPGYCPLLIAEHDRDQNRLGHLRRGRIHHRHNPRSNHRDTQIP